MDIAALLDQPAAIVGTTGAGKTFAAKGAVEHLLDLGRRVVIIDPTGAWYGLRAGADGEAKGGFPVLIFGGDHADIPIAPGDGAEIAVAIAGRNVQAIVDTSEMTGGEKTAFLTPFLEKLYAANKAALHIVVDEADEIAPQNPMPEERRLSGIFDKIVRRGRIKGFRPLMITQRPAVLHKNVLSQIATLIALKLTSPQDRKAIESWVQGNADADEAREVMRTLPRLARGEGWVWSPAADVLARTTFPSIRTFDSSRTPEAGETVVAAALTPVDVESLRGALAKAHQPDAGPTPRANDRAPINPEALRAEYERGHADGFVAGEHHWTRIGVSYGLTAVRGAVNALNAGDIARGKQEGSPLPDQQPKPSATPTAVKSPSAVKSAPQATGTGSLNSAARKLLVVLDTDPPVRRTWTQAATLAGLKARGGHFNAGRKTLLETGRVVEVDGLVQVAEPSVKAGAPVSDPASLVDRWEAVLSGAAPRILRCLFERGGIGEREDVAKELQLTARGGYWNAAWKELRDNGIVFEDGKRVRLSELFRPNNPAMTHFGLLKASKGSNRAASFWVAEGLDGEAAPDAETSVSQR